MIRNAPPKHPDSSKWYWLEWPAAELDGATITNSSWQLPTGLVKNDSMLSGRLVGIRLSGGSLDDDLVVWNNITTSSGEDLREALLIRIRETGH